MLFLLLGIWVRFTHISLLFRLTFSCCIMSFYLFIFKLVKCIQICFQALWTITLTISNIRKRCIIEDLARTIHTNIATIRLMINIGFFRNRSFHLFLYYKIINVYKRYENISFYFILFSIMRRAHFNHLKFL